jgi:thiaminase
MVSRAYKSCLLLTEKMVKHGFLRQINREDLAKIISRYIGADERTIDKYVRVCVQWQLLTPHPQTKNVFYINLEHAAKEMKQVFNRPMKQLTLQQAKS